MTILAYHQVDRRRDFAWNMIQPECLAGQMRILAERGCRGVPFREAVETDEEDLVGITFDDAMEGVVRYGLPVLRDFGFRATLFVPTAWVGKRNMWDSRLVGRRTRHAGWEDLSTAAAAGWEIASHGHTHRDLASLGAEELEKELLLSKNLIRERIGAETDSISWPFGRVNDKAAGAARRTGYRRGCISFAAANRGDPFRVGRIGVRRFDRRREFIAKLEEGPLHRFQVCKDRAAHFFSIATPLVWQRIWRIGAT